MSQNKNNIRLFSGKKIISYLFFLLLFIIFSLLTSNYFIKRKSSEFIYSDANLIPECKTALLLGTSKKLKNGTINLYFKYRIDAAIELYKNKKIKYFIVSGDNSVKDYNEPQDMKDELIRNGIPDSIIFLDYAGFRTFDSVIRTKEIFSQHKFIVISQKFHNERAVFIARDQSMEAYGYNAKDVNAYYGFKTQLREYFARVKVFIDKLINRKPKYLGDKISIE